MLSAHTHLPGVVGNVDIVAVDDPRVEGGAEGHSRQNEEYKSVHDE